MKAPSAPACLRVLDRTLSRRAVVLPLFAVVAFAFTSPLWAHPMNLGHGDWLWFHFMWDTSRKSWLYFHEPPWWNPYYCGGNLGIPNGNSFGAAPLWMLFLPLPTAVAMKAYLGTITFLGLWGAWELASRYYARGTWTVVSAVLFSCCGYLGWHMNGQTGMANLHLLPWVVLFYLRGAERPVLALAAGGVLAEMWLGSGVYPVVLTSVGLAMHGVVVLFEGRWRRTLAFLRSGVIACVSGLAYASIKLVPFFDYLRDHRREIPKDDAVGLDVLFRALVERRTTETQIWPHVGYVYAWWGEYSNYIGWGGIVLVLVGIVASARRHRREIVLALLAAALCWGDHGRFSPYALLRSAPMMGNLRVPTRYWIVADVWLSCLVAFGGWKVSRLVVTRVRPGLRGVVLGAMLAFSAYFVVDLVRSDGIAIFRGAMPTRPAPPEQGAGELHQIRGASWDMFQYPPQNLGTLRCFDELMIETSPALRPNLPHEVYLDDPSAGSVTIVRYAPSTWDVDVDVTRPATVVLNQSFFRGWTAEGGTIVPHRGLVAAEVPAGKTRLRLQYRPRGYVLAIAITLVALAITAWAAFRQWKRDDSS